MSRLVFWISSLLLVWAQALYGPFLALLRRVRGDRRGPPVQGGSRPRVSLIVAAYREEAVIAAKVANALALDWPREQLEVIVAVDGGAEAGADRTAELARAAGADQVLELPRGGKIRAQDAAVRAASGELLAFGDANATWAPDALQRLAARFADPQVGYVCGRVQFVSDGRYEPGGRLLALRAVAARAGVRARVGDRRQRRHLRGAAARPTSRSTR